MELRYVMGTFGTCDLLTQTSSIKDQNPGICARLPNVWKLTVCPHFGHPNANGKDRRATICIHNGEIDTLIRGGQRTCDPEVRRVRNAADVLVQPHPIDVAATEAERRVGRRVDQARPLPRDVALPGTARIRPQKVALRRHRRKRHCIRRLETSATRGRPSFEFAASCAVQRHHAGRFLGHSTASEACMPMGA